MTFITTYPDAGDYDRVLVAMSGGKDSIASLIAVLDTGVDPARIELHHHLVDGRGDAFMNLPSTEGWCQAIADAFDVKLHLSWRDGGFLREMLRCDQPTAPILFERPGSVGIASAGGSGPCGTRHDFHKSPQTSRSVGAAHA